MVTLAVLVMVVGFLWLAASLVGFVFKLAFAVVGGVIGLMAGLLGLLVGALALLLVAPVVLLALLPVMLPVLALGGLVWLVVRASRRPTPVPVNAGR
ncbi:hypothetical protein ATSB10_35180 [Dyella thiooxydans]|uniref:Uncharacterized protein n=1 Tax=Dyella thiooxydans TaxID=445710 RepID=A0A160N5S6_9GAMM|nr:hypothetical protein [Dyella thiooxydans]AND70972.1 hypothetical protein ATSB10_35180 [Dyella thiooxydans]